MITRCPNAHEFLTEKPGNNCPVCSLKGRFVRLYDGTSGSELSPESLESLLVPISQIDLEAVPALAMDAFQKLRGALNGIRRRTVYLTSGDPGIGKSTLLTQIALDIWTPEQSVGSTCYVAGEEPREAVAERVHRISHNTKLMFQDRIAVFEGGDLGLLEQALEAPTAPAFDLIVVDSIQTMWSPRLDSVPGSISQVIFCTNEFKRLARERDCTVWLLAHVTKDGTVAGPKTLEHLVDVVTSFEGDGEFSRLFVISKNRRGKIAGPVSFMQQLNGGWKER